MMSTGYSKAQKFTKNFPIFFETNHLAPHKHWINKFHFFLEHAGELRIIILKQKVGVIKEPYRHPHTDAPYTPTTDRKLNHLLTTKPTQESKTLEQDILASLYERKARPLALTDTTSGPLS
jgi:hypothetical protein